MEEFKQFFDGFFLDHVIAQSGQLFHSFTTTDTPTFPSTFVAPSSDNKTNASARTRHLEAPTTGWDIDQLIDQHRVRHNQAT
jgi:hypothetical protein